MAANRVTTQEENFMASNIDDSIPACSRLTAVFPTIQEVL
jgi:hypothetical protein